MADTYQLLIEAAKAGDLNTLMHHFESQGNRHDTPYVQKCVKAAIGSGQAGTIAYLYDLMPDHQVIATAAQSVRKTRIAEVPDALRQTLFALEGRGLSLQTSDSISLLENLAAAGDLNSFQFASAHSALRFDYRRGNDLVLATFACPGNEGFMKALWGHPVFGTERARAQAMKCAIYSNSPRLAAFIESQGMPLERADAILGSDYNLADTAVLENSPNAFQFLLERGMRPATLNSTDMSPECRRVWSASRLQGRAAHSSRPPAERRSQGLA